MIENKKKGVVQMKWTTKEEYQQAMNEYNNKMYYAGRFGTLEEIEKIRNILRKVKQ